MNPRYNKLSIYRTKLLVPWTGLQIGIWKWAVKWPPKLKYDWVLYLYERSLIYDTKNVRISSFKDSEREHQSRLMLDT